MGQGAAGVITVNFPNEPYSANLWLSRIGNNYDPALGFVSRTGINQIYFSNRYRWYLKDSIIQQVNLSAEANAFTDLHGRLLDRNVFYPEIEIDTVPGDYAYVQYQEHMEVLDASFEIRRGIVIPAGRYKWTSPRLIAGTTRSRPVDVRFDFLGGGFYGGTQRS